MAPIERFVRIGTGHDAADASFATIIGSATLAHMVVWAEQRVPNLISNQSVSGVAASTTN
jgi:hypothetical protein